MAMSKAVLGRYSPSSARARMALKSAVLPVRRFHS
jgi:hypothetical protein